MTWILNNILQIFTGVKDLLPLERKMRVPGITVNPGPRGGAMLPKVVRPWKPLPNISKMEIKLGAHDWLLLLFGLYKRYRPNITFWAWRNGPANKYVHYMFKRLSTQVKLGLLDEASKTVWLLMRSHSYQCCCFNYVARGWYKSMKWSEVKKTMAQIKVLAKTKQTSINFKRVYLEQPNKIRPLGVPTLAWRVYLHMYNNILTEWRLLSETGKQHAYLPGRGVITAWEALLTKLDKAPNIYEADFKGFFDSIRHYGLLKVLVKDVKISKPEFAFIRELNKSVVKLTKEDKINEPDRDIIFDPQGKLTYNSQAGQNDFNTRVVKGWDSRIPGERIISGDIRNYNPAPNEILTYLEGHTIVTPMIDGRYSAVGDRPFDRPLTDWEKEFYDRVEKLKKPTREQIASQWGLSPSRPTVQWKEKDYGVPQGAPTSCSLATLALRPLERQEDILCYADDVIYFPKSSSVDAPYVLTRPEMGIVVNEAKSRWAKKDGEWLVDYIQFVGFRYYPAKYVDTFIEAIGYPVLLLFLIDMLFINWPCFSLCWTLLVSLKRYERGKSRFTASTRNGATLEFGTRESFIMFLNTARTLLLNTYYESKLSGFALESWISHNLESWLKLKQPVKLITESFIKRAEFFHKTRQKAAKLTDKTSVKDWVPHIKLTGWFMARLQANTFDINFLQDFRLKWTAKSWLDIHWVKYSFNHIIPKSALNIFTASSYACDGLLNMDFKKRSKVRYVFVSSRKLKGQIKKLRATFYQGNL